MRRKALAVVVIAIVHYAATIIVILRNFGSTMRGFDSGDISESTAADRMFELLQHILFFPLVAPLGDVWPTALRTGAFPRQHVPFIANSLLWALVLVTLFRLWRRKAV